MKILAIGLVGIFFTSIIIIIISTLGVIWSNEYITYLKIDITAIMLAVISGIIVKETDWKL